MTVLLSIKPEFAEKIFDGTKKYEYRKCVFKRPGIEKVVVYVSSPIKKVLGEFTIDDVLEDGVESVWEKTSQFSGISEAFYFGYFRHRDTAYAIKIGRTKRYKTAKELSDYNIRTAPQSFAYIG